MFFNKIEVSSLLLGQNESDKVVCSEQGSSYNGIPKDCHSIHLESGNDFSVRMLSTSTWFQHSVNSTRLYTFGMVFLELDTVLLPVSLTGAEIDTTSMIFETLTDPSSLSPSDGTLFYENKSKNCQLKLSSEYLCDFLTENTSVKAYLSQIDELLPDWLKLYWNGNALFGANNISTAVERGDQVQTGECKGAPLVSDSLYLVYRLGDCFNLSIYGQQVQLPANADGKKLCLIVDVCQDNGSSVFLILQEESGDLLENITIVQHLLSERGVHMALKGLGVSLSKDITVQTESSSSPLWGQHELNIHRYV